MLYKKNKETVCVKYNKSNKIYFLSCKSLRIYKDNKNQNKSRNLSTSKENKEKNTE